GIEEPCRGSCMTAGRRPWRGSRGGDLPSALVRARLRSRLQRMPPKRRPALARPGAPWKKVRVAVVAHSGKSFGGGLEELRAVLARAGHPHPLWFEVPKSAAAKR